jgi:hypothetical protein
VRVKVADHQPKEYYLPSSQPARSSGANATTYVDRTHSKTHVHSASLFDVGILRDTLVPSLKLLDTPSVSRPKTGSGRLVKSRMPGGRLLDDASPLA